MFSGPSDYWKTTTTTTTTTTTGWQRRLRRRPRPPRQEQQESRRTRGVQRTKSTSISRNQHQSAKCCDCVFSNLKVQAIWLQLWHSRLPGRWESANLYWICYFSSIPFCNLFRHSSLICRKPYKSKCGMTVNICQLVQDFRHQPYHTFNDLTRSKNWHQQGNLPRNCCRSSPPSPPAKSTLAIAKFSQTQISVCISQAPRAPREQKHPKKQLNLIDTTKQPRLQSSSWPQKCCPKTHTYSHCWKHDFLVWILRGEILLKKHSNHERGESFLCDIERQNYQESFHQIFPHEETMEKKVGTCNLLPKSSGQMRPLRAWLWFLARNSWARFTV